MKWEDPPGAVRSKGSAKKMAAEAAELKENPKRWGVIWERPYSAEAAREASLIQAHLTRADYRAFWPPHSYEAAKRTVKVPVSRKVVRVYARYVGEKK